MEIVLDAGCLVPNITSNGGTAFHARVRVRNKGRSTATGASGYLVNPQITNTNGGITGFSEDVVSGAWSHRGARPLDIPRSFDGFYLDVFGVFTNPHGTIAACLLGSDMGNALHAASQQATKLATEVIIAGENFSPARETIVVSWDGTSRGLQIEVEK